MKTAEARTSSKFDRSLCKRCGDLIRRADPIFQEVDPEGRPGLSEPL
jgi:hypothetical protein